MKLFVRGLALTATSLLVACASGVRSDDVGGSGGGPLFEDPIQQPQEEPPNPFDGESCGSETYGKQVSGSVLVVLDRSGSMAQSSKWLKTRGALLTMLEEASPELEVGLLPFPAGSCSFDPLYSCLATPDEASCPDVLADGCCGDIASAPPVAVTPLAQSQPAIQSWFDNAPMPDGFTPVLGALETAYAVMQSHPGEGQRYILLMTDGVPTLHTTNFANTGIEALDACGEEQDIVSRVEAAASGPNPVRTFVIGSPGSEIASPLLSELAIVGGTSKGDGCENALGTCHYQIGSDNFQDDLSQVLKTISGLITDCTFDIPQGDEGVDPNAVNVAIQTTSELIPVARSASHTNGWDFVDGDATRIQLHGPSCDTYNESENNELLIILGCETVIE